MKTPEEIKKGLECCPVCSKSCAYYKGIDCYAELHYDALALIEQLKEREWELFSLLSSAFYGKQCYFKQDGEVKPRYFKVDDGLVYSRVTGKYMSFDQAIDEFAETLTGEDEAQSGTDMNVPRWISVENEMPEDDVEVLVYAIGDKESSIIAMTSYTHHMYGYNIEGWRSPWQYFFDNYKITHWMPLPEAPKEDA